MMEQSCKNESCKRKLKDYRELTSKQYDDIDALETDIKDKEAFVQTVVKARNNYQSEVALLKKKNGDLIKENNGLLEKVDQLDEDTDTGINLLRNAHERESKLNKELEVCKVKSNKTDELMKEMVKENESLKSKFNFVKDNLEKNLKANQECQNSSNSKDSKIKGLEMELLACREKLTINDAKHGTTISNMEDKVKEQADVIDILNEENISLKQRHGDLTDELLSKNMEIEEIENENKNKSFQNSASSLDEELQNVKITECADCSLTFTDLEDLREHRRQVHEEKIRLKLALLDKLSFLESKVSEQKTTFTSSLFHLKNKEVKESESCSGCKGFCRIYHTKHNFVKSRSEELFLEMFPRRQETAFLPERKAGCIRKRYTCNQCDKEFSKQGDLKKHHKSEHKLRGKKIGQV